MENSQSILSDTTVKLVGSAYSAQDAANALSDLSGGSQNAVQMQIHADDFVGRLLGGNPATYGSTPEGSSLIKEWIHMFGKVPTVHSCYGGASDECKDRYGPATTIIVPANTPASGILK